MLTFFTDESHIKKDHDVDHNLTVYGGLVLSESTFYDLNQFVYKLKDKYVLPQEMEIKWSFEGYLESMKRIGYLDKTISKKSHPNLYESFKPDHVNLKNEILDKVASSDVKIIIAIRPNKLLNATENQDIEYSIAAVARKFEKFLLQENQYGILLADDMKRKIHSKAVIDYEYILKLCCRGSGNVVFNRLISIVPTINSHLSPIHQINDIVLGTIQYYILDFIRGLNGPTRNRNQARDIFGKIKEKFLTSSQGSYVINNGILMYPPKVSRSGTEAGKFLDKLDRQLEDDFGII